MAWEGRRRRRIKWWRRGGWVVSLGKKEKFFALSFIRFESNLLLLGGLVYFLLRIFENAGE